MKIKIKSIKIDRSNRDTQRIRKDFGDIQKLVESIEKHGLIHPIVVDELSDDSKYSYSLIAGERRLTAALYLGQKEIDATVRSQLNEFERKELELEENARRKDLSWEEKIEALRQLDELKRSIHGTRLPGSIEEKGWTIQDTADAIGASLGTVSQDIKLAKDLLDSPKLREKIAGMTKMVARKVIEREKDALRIKERMNRNEIVIDSNLILGRAENLITKIKGASIHCLITDPPFAVDAIHKVEEGNLSGKYDRGTNIGDTGEMMKIYDLIIPQLSRVMVPGAHFYMFFGIDWYEELKMKFFKSGFVVHPVPLIWSKGRGTMIPNPYHYVPSYEFILFGCKFPQKRTLLKPRPNCLTEYPTDAPQTRIHPLQKPFSLIKMFIENSTVPGETVLDCFAGSGIVLKVARELGRRSVGFESDEINFYKAQEFLTGEKK